MEKQRRVDTAQSGAAAEIEGGMARGKAPTRDDADAYELDDLQGNLRQVVAQTSETKRPIVILESGRAVAAVLDFGELQRLYDVEQRLVDLEESLEDQGVVTEFIQAEQRGEVEWMPEEEFAAFQQQLLDDVRTGNIDKKSGMRAAE